MAGASLLTLIDDIAALLDDIALMTKVAAKKTSGVLGDDLALNAQQVSGVRASRELPVVWAVAKGSLLNKAILVPLALLISALVPWLIVPLLMAGGLFLCFEGVEKLLHKSEHNNQQAAVIDDVAAYEKQKIRGAIRTDFILSAEIIVITLGVVAHTPFVQQLLVLTLISVLITVGVYGLVAGIVKLDDLGLYLQQKTSALAQVAARGILAFAPWLMKALSVVGTLAMFMVGGGIIAHNLPWVASLFASALHVVDNALLSSLGHSVLNALFGIACGALALALFSLWQRTRAAFA